MSLAFTVACGGTPANDIRPPDTDLISVFYPVDGVVRGIGLAGAVDGKVGRISIRAHPTTTLSCAEVNEDGSFEFSIVAIDNDVLEITGARGEKCEERGAPTFIRVPESPLPPVDFVCCHSGGEKGTCQSIQRFEAMEPCPDGGAVAQACVFDEDCGADEGEILVLEPGQITVSAPDTRGRVVVEGAVEYKNALVRVANLGLSPLGYKSPGTRQATITNDKGQFRFSSVAAAGDDELAIQVQDLNGFRSPRIGKRVPDAALEGLDVIGVYAYEDLGGGTPGPIAIHIAPYGVDSRGICPDSGTPDDWICYTGGVTHDMVTITQATIAATSELPNPRRTATSSTSPRFFYNTGVIGDVRSGAQDIVIVLDLSEEATPTAADRQIQIEEVKRFIDRIRRRDRVGVVAMTDYTAGIRLTASDPKDPGLRTYDQRPNLKSALDALVGPPSDKSVSGGVEGLVIASRDMLRAAGAINGKIVMLLGAAPNADDETGDDKQSSFGDRKATAFDGVLGKTGTSQPRYQAHIIQMPQGSPQMGDDQLFLDSIADFSLGRTWLTSRSGPELEQTLTDVLQELSGAFILLYDVDVPCTGKSMTLNLSLELEIAGERRGTQYTGPVRIARACGDD